MAKLEDFGFDNGEYVNTYAGIPLDQIQRTADTLASRHYQNIASASQLEILANQMKSKLLPGAKGYADSHINQINQALQEMAKNGGEHSTARINALATALQSDQGLLTGLQRANEYNQQSQLIDKMTAEGQTPLYDTARREALANASVDHDIYKAPYNSEVQPYLDPTPEMESIWKTVNPDSYEGDIRAAMQTAPSSLIGQAFNGENPDLPLFFEAIKTGGISGKKINEMLENAYSSFKNTKSFKQQTGNLVGKSEKEVKDEFLKHGLLRVFSNLQREYRPTPAWAGRGDTGTDNSPAGVRSPLPALVRSKFNTGVDTDRIDANGNMVPSWFQNFVGGSGLYNAESLKKDAEMYRGDAAKATDPGQRDLLIKQAEHMEKLAESAGKSSQELTEAQTKDMLTYARTAIEVLAGQDSGKMTDAEVKAKMSTPEGKALLDGYIKQYTDTRYHQPFINNIVDKKTRDANEDFAGANISQRGAFNERTGEYFENFKDSKGNVHKELLPLSKAILDGKVKVEGYIDPKHAYTELVNGDESFTRGMRVQIPIDDKGNVDSYIISQLPGTTSPIDINENVLYNRATEVPGRWAKITPSMEVMSPASDEQKSVIWQRYGLKSGVPQEQFFNNEIVVVKDGEDTKIFPNYTMAAQWLATNKGMKLKFPKKK